MPSEYISIETDLDAAMELLSQIDGNQKTMRKHVLSAVGTGTRKAIRKNYNSLLHKHTGGLYKYISKKLVKSGQAVVLKPKARGKNQVFYGYALVKGSTIKPKNGDFLTFKINDKWIRTKEVKLPQKDFMTGPADRYLRSNEAKETVNKQVQKEIDNAIKKAKQKENREW